MSAEKHPDTIAEFQHEGQTYEIDDLSRSCPSQENTYAIYQDGEQVADMYPLTKVRNQKHLIRMAREILDADSDDAPPHTGEVTTLADVYGLVAAAVEADPSLVSAAGVGEGGRP